MLKDLTGDFPFAVPPSAEQMKRGGIYRIRNLVNGNYYTGSAILFQRRWLDHLSRLRRGKHGNPRLQRAFLKYGERSFTFEIIEFRCRGHLAREGEYLRACYGTPACYNATLDTVAPMRGRHHSAATRRKAGKGRFIRVDEGNLACRSLYSIKGGCGNER